MIGDNLSVDSVETEVPNLGVKLWINVHQWLMVFAACTCDFISSILFSTRNNVDTIYQCIYNIIYKPHKREKLH